MRDVSKKSNSLRSAIAEATIVVSPDTIRMMRLNTLPKGDPLPIARVAAIQAAKNTSQMIPFCHPIPIDYAEARFTIGERSVVIRTEVRTVWKTGVEMEALTAASVAALTIYDMIKMVDDNVAIESVRLISKRGGKSDIRNTDQQKYRAAVLVLSDTVHTGVNTDISGAYLRDRLVREGFEISNFDVLPDEPSEISQRLKDYADVLHLDLVLTTGGTGLGPRDSTPNATLSVSESEIPGISEALRSYGQERTPMAMLSRGVAVRRGNTLIINLPGSKRGVEESLDALMPQLFHAFPMIAGQRHEGDKRFSSGFDDKR